MIMMLALAATLALADDGYDVCMERAATNPDFISCGSAMLARRDAELNRVWKDVYAQLDAPTKTALLSEQRAWIAFKEKSCAYWGSGAYGREGQTVHFYTCRAAVLDQRIDYLGEIGGTGAE